MNAPALSPAQKQQQLNALNMNIRNLVTGSAVDMWQQIFSTAVTPSAQNTVNVPVQNVGLIKGFLVKVSGTLRNTDGALAATLTPYGASNVLSQITFTDLNNTVRIQTAGWHMGIMNSAKGPLVFGGAYAPNVPVKYGQNFTVQSSPASIAFGTDGAIQFYYYVPLSFSSSDLRGAMYAGVVNATANLQLVINTTPGVAAAGDPTLAIYSGTANLIWKAATTVTVTVWQNYLDQLPMGQNGQALLPPVDLSVIYELKNVALSGIVQGQDFPVPYANFRTFYSTTAIYNNAGVLNVGSDVNYWALRAANTTSIFQYGPSEAALFARGIFGADMPAGGYFFNHGNRPISTQQFGNMQLVLNPSAVGAGPPLPSLLVGFEDIASVSQVQFAGSLNPG
jgi:hypothetical protein